MDKKTAKTKDFLLDLFFPKFCLGCQKEGFYLCEDCRSLLDISEYNYCLCDKPLRLPVGSKLGKCSRCSDKKLSGFYFALSYKDPSASSGRETSFTKKLIYNFKYKPYLKDLSKTLASILIEHFIKTGKNTEEIWAPSGVPAVLIPIPLDKKKLKNRGYNQSELLAKELAEILKIPVLSDVLIKNVSTKPQMELKKEEREKNLLNAFAVSPNCHSRESGNPAAISGKKVFLVDDVYTTGSTMQECASTLLEAGAKTVWGIALAREG